MIPFWKKTDKHSKPQSAQKRRQNAKPAVPRTAQQSIPMQRMFEDGTCRVKPNYYTRTIQYQDINYQLAQQEDKTAIFEEWCSFLNFFDALMKNKIIGVCPNCGKSVVEREKGWFCENRECRFVLWKDNAFFKRLGKRLDAHVADKLLRDGRVRLKDCKSAKGKTYNATVLLSCEADGRSKFSLEFEGGC